MPTLREQLLQAGLVSAEQAQKAEDPGRGKSRRSKRGGRGRNKTTDAAGREVDLEDPKKLEVMKAIERHRLRESFEGDIPFNFTVRGDAKIRKMFVDVPTAAKLGSGALAIVENGSAQDHVIVEREAVAAIRAVDPDAVRFHAGS
jgi:uncharacterized protein YaiL (DUF2058 family)